MVRTTMGSGTQASTAAVPPSASSREARLPASRRRAMERRQISTMRSIVRCGHQGQGKGFGSGLLCVRLEEALVCRAVVCDA